MAAPTILVVDDTADVLELTSFLLENAGYVVLRSDNSPDALAVLRDGHDIDLLLTDITMPEMDGLELARQARAIRPSLPVLYITGYSHLLTEGTGEVFGPILRKPYHQDELIRQIEELLAAAEDADLVRAVALEMVQRSPNALNEATEAEELALAQGDLLSAEAWRDIAAAIAALAGNSGPK
jgi:CheY-like chemotaxis protein